MAGNPIIFKITEAGRLAVLNAQKQGISLSLKNVVVGTAKYNANGRETKLQAEVLRAGIVTSGIEKDSKILRFSTTLNSPTLRNIHEIGLLTDDNKLFAIAASTEALFTVYANVSFVGSFGLTLAALDTSAITVTTDRDGSIATAMMEQHLAAPNPHTQYAKTVELDKTNARVQKIGTSLAGVTSGLLKQRYDFDNHVKDYNAHEIEYNTLKTNFEKHNDVTKNPHDQYLLKVVMQAHVTTSDPHPQYLQDSDVSVMRTEIEELKRKLQLAIDSPSELPIGSIYTTTNNYADSKAVNHALGYGQWARFAEGRTLVGVSKQASDPQWTKSLKNTYGNYIHQLKLDEIPSHTHGEFPFNKFTAIAAEARLETQGSGDYKRADQEIASGRYTKNDWIKATEKKRGNNEPHNNVQPSITVAYWLRVG